MAAMKAVAATHREGFPQDIKIEGSLFLWQLVSQHLLAMILEHHHHSSTVELVITEEELTSKNFSKKKLPCPHCTLWLKNPCAEGKKCL